MGIRSWLESRFTPDEEDLREEIRAHLAIAAEERIAEGADRQEARYAALREFGNVTLTTEATRRVWTPRWMDNLRDLMSDVRYGIRALAKNPVFSLTVVAVLAIGIGLNAAVFTMLKGIVLSPLAGVDGAARLAVLHGETSAGRPVRISYPDYRDLRDHDRAFSGLLGSIVAKVNLGRGRGARQIWGEFVTGNYFQVLDVRAELGRTLEPSDEVEPGGHPVVVLSEGLWRRDFGADPNIIGRTVEINNLHLTVVGVADRAFHGTTVVYDVEAFIPVMMAPDLGFTFGSDRATPVGILSDRAAGLFFPHGYLRPGTTLEEAAAQSGALWERLAEDRPITAPAERLKVVPFAQVPSGAPSFMMPTLGVLGAMGLLVLAIACANIAGLVLVRGVSRRGEIAVRLALGASRARIVRLLVVENLALAAPGAALGVLLAHYGIPVLAGYAQWLAAPLRIHFNTDVDGLVIGFTVLVACASVLLFGFVPALSSSRVDLVSTINEDASPRGAARGRFRSALVVAQVAVSLLLLVGAGLAARSVDAARRAHPGFDAGNLTAVAFDLRQNGYDERRGRVFSRRLLAAVRSDPSIEGATLAAHVPLNMTDTRADRLTLEGHDARTGDDVAFMSNAVAPDYFRTLRIPVLAGREFASSDDEAARPVVMVNDTMARRFWGDAASAVGQRVRVGSGDWRTVIGVAADVKYSRMDEAPRPYYYLPLLQAYRSNLTLHARGHAGQSGDPAAAVHRHVDTVRAHMTRLDPELPIMSARPMTEAAGGAFIFLDLTAMMLFIFGVAGMALAAMGTYGLVSYTVKQSTHEIAIRMALGASGSSVVRQFLGRGLRLGAGGAALGVATALAAAGLLERVLFGVSPTDAVTFLIALAIVFGSVALATVIPAWRAARTSPLCALRHH